MTRRELDRLYLGTRKGLFIAECSGDRWALHPPHFRGDEVSQVLPSGERVFVALRLGHYGAKVHRSLDGGATFEEVPTPAYPPEPSGEPFTWAVQQIWALAEGGGDTLWAGDLPGGLWRSDDAGESWSLNRALWDHPSRKKWFGGGYKQPGLHSIVVDPRDAARLTVGLSIGGVWRSDDAGGSWRPATHGMRAPYMPPALQHAAHTQDPHALAQCAAAPDVWWCQHHGGLYRSTDDAATWREIPEAPPSAYGFPMAVHPADPDTAWRVPAESDACRVPVDGRFVVTRTRDGGASWDVLTRGLPQEHAYHLVLRHALDVDTAGRHLALGTNLGGVWTSGDGGDSWALLSNDLPPVNCVRFGPA
jgi:hypothetical protein